MKPCARMNELVHVILAICSPNTASRNPACAYQVPEPQNFPTLISRSGGPFKKNGALQGLSTGPTEATIGPNQPVWDIHRLRSTLHADPK